MNEQRRSENSETNHRILDLRFNLIETKRSIRKTRDKQTRYQQLEDLCYVNRVTNEEAINNLNLYLNNLKKVSKELVGNEVEAGKKVNRCMKRYKKMVMDYRDRKDRGNIIIRFISGQ